jgi:hypothetical protein
MAGDDNYCIPRDTANKIKQFLDSHGSIQAVIERLKDFKNNYLYQDITNDDIKEFVFMGFHPIDRVVIFKCENSTYKIIQIETDDYVGLNSVQDLNKNETPDLLLTGGFCSGSGCFGVYTYEWNGTEFVNLSPSIGTIGKDTFEMKDLNRDGIKEFILRGDRPGSCCIDLMTPWRFKTTIYSWNSKEFSESYISFDPAIYRFQAIQDADREVLYGNLEKALPLYQDAIFSNKLIWWSKERRDYEVKLFYDSFGASISPTPPPYPTEDTTEYPKLAAYAYYRIMLIHLVQNHAVEANTVYNTLQQKFGSDPYGKPYVEMASAFWEAYQSTHKMYDGCAAAIDYAVKHPEILIPLASDYDYHGLQSHIYKPEDVCPFR